MKWYLAVLVMEAQVADDGGDVALVDVQYRLIRAADGEVAYRRALELGAGENHAYSNEVGDEVRWSFAGLHDLREIEAGRLRDGVEIYSTMAEAIPRAWARPKDQLSVFWNEANKHRTADEILGSGSV